MSNIWIFTTTVKINQFIFGLNLRKTVLVFKTHINIAESAKIILIFFIEEKQVLSSGKLEDFQLFAVSSKFSAFVNFKQFFFRLVSHSLVNHLSA
jgi:hypothetical protein